MSPATLPWLSYEKKGCNVPMPLGLFTKLQSMFSRVPRQEYLPEDIERARAFFSQPHISEEARQRKYRSEDILKAEGVRINLFLPVIETEAEMRLLTNEEVAFRTMTLLAVAVKGEGLEQPLVEKFVADYGLKEHLTPEERVFIEDPIPEDQSRVRFCWRYEAAWTLLWALRFVAKLKKPGAVCDAGQAMWYLHSRGAARFIADARLRAPKEILDQADLIYRYDWAAVDARVNGKPKPAGVDGEITVERHHATLWLIGQENAEWDDIITNT
jgi:hypothetical protein